MLGAIETLLLAFVVLSAAAALWFDYDVNSVLALGVFSISMAVLFVVYQAPDAAMAEAVVGAGLTTALFLVTIGKISREDGA